jgi:hypothetical protein
MEYIYLPSECFQTLFSRQLTLRYLTPAVGTNHWLLQIYTDTTDVEMRPMACRVTPAGDFNSISTQLHQTHTANSNISYRSANAMESASFGVKGNLI